MERATPAGHAGLPTRGVSRRARHARGRLAQRLRGVVVDGRIDCPAQTSAFSDAALSWFALARLTSRVDYAGSALLSGVVLLLRITSAATFVCASMAGEVFSERPIGLLDLQAWHHQERQSVSRLLN